MRRLIPLAMLLALVSACSPARSPAAPSLTPLPPAPATPLPASGTFVATGEVLSIGEQPCDLLRGTPGETVQRSWDLSFFAPGYVVFGNLYEEPAPEGALDGQAFSTLIKNGNLQLGSSCQWSSESLIGTFAADFNSFVATETVVYRALNGEKTRVTRLEGRRK